MRKNQLSFTIESFGDQAKNGQKQRVHGYIDANNRYELFNEFLDSLHRTYANDIPFEEFCDKIKNYDGSRFGATDIVVDGETKKWEKQHGQDNN